MCFLNALEGIALDFFHTHLSMNAPFSKIVQVVSRQFNSEHHQQPLLSQVQAAKLQKFKKEHKHYSLPDSLDVLIVEINCVIPQLSDELNTERHKLNL